MATHKKNFFDIVAKPTTVRSQSGYVNDVDADIWELRGRPIDFGLLVDAVTKGFLEEIKHHFAIAMNAQGHSDASFRSYFSAFKDCLHFTFRGTGRKVDTLTSGMISEWRDEASAASYPYFLKLLITVVRTRDPGAYPNVSDKVLKTLRKPEADVQHVLSLDPKKGPWLEQELLDQDRAIEQAYTSGDWHVEKFVLFRLYGMRPDQLATMKIGDVRSRSTGHTKGEIRWPFAKNDLAADSAPWWPLGGALLTAMDVYLGLRLDGIPKSEQERLPLFTPKGLPGAWRITKEIKPSRERGYEGHIQGFQCFSMQIRGGRQLVSERCHDDFRILGTDIYNSRLKDLRKRSQQAEADYQSAKSAGNTAGMELADHERRQIGETIGQMVDFKSGLARFSRTYAYIAQLIDLGDPELENLASFSKLLSKRLDGIPTDQIDLSGIRLTGYDIQTVDTPGHPDDDGTDPVLKLIGPGGSPAPGGLPVYLQELIERLNGIFGEAAPLKDQANFVNHIAAIARENEIVMAQVEKNPKEQALKGNLPGAIQAAVVRAMTSNSSLAATLLKEDRQSLGIMTNLIYDLLKNGTNIDLRDLDPS